MTSLPETLYAKTHIRIDLQMQLTNTDLASPSKVQAVHSQNHIAHEAQHMPCGITFDCPPMQVTYRGHTAGQKGMHSLHTDNLSTFQWMRS